MKNRKHLVYITVAIVFFAVLGVVLVHRQSFVDFPVYHLAARSLMSGRSNLYSPEFSGGPLMDYRYPPFFITVFGWLGLLPPIWAAYVWYWLCILEIVGSVLILRYASKAQFIVEGAGYSEKTVWLIALFAVGAYFVKALKFGNAHLLMTFLLFGSFYFGLRHKDWLAAAALSLAITIKITPLLAIPYFVFNKRWKLLILTGIFLVTFNLAPAMYFGFNKNAELLRTWVEHVVLTQEAHERNSAINLSLKGQLLRYLTEVDYSQKGAGTENTDTDYPSVNVLSLPANLISRLWMFLDLAVYVSFLALVWLLARRKSDLHYKNSTKLNLERRLTNYHHPTDLEGVPMLELGLVICLMLFIEPLTPKIYFIQLLWPIVALTIFALNRAHPIARFCKYSLFIIAALNVILPLLPGRSVQRLLLVIGVDFYITCLLLLALTLALISSTRVRHTPL